jgi:hypothetical protein
MVIFLIVKLLYIYAYGKPGREYLLERLAAQIGPPYKNVDSNFLITPPAEHGERKACRTKK